MQSRGHADFKGYWMGVDPLDGGDARRSLILRSDGRSRRGPRLHAHPLRQHRPRLRQPRRRTVVGRTVMQSNTLTIQCFNDGATVQFTSDLSWSSAA